MYKVYILHGWSYSTQEWKPFLKLFEQGGVEFKMLKIPGLTAPLTHVWTLDDYVDWISQITKNHEPITILGHSNGGRIAVAFAAKYPNKISKLILVDSAGIIDKRIRKRIKRILFRLITKVGSSLTTQTAFALSGVEGLKTLIYKLAGEQDYNKANPILKKTMLNLISQDLEPTFSRVKVPTLVIWGRNDTITPISDGRKIHELISGSKFEIVENAKHSPQFTHPKVTSEIIVNFLHHKS